MKRNDQGIFVPASTSHDDEREIFVPLAKSLKGQYPSVELAYPIALQSYDVAIKRLDAVDARIQTLLAFAVSVTVIIPSLGSARGLSFQSIWFILALIFMAMAIGLGVYARLTGKVRVLNPATFYQDWLHFSEWEFKKNLIYFAAEDFDFNTQLAHRKWQCCVAVTILFSLEAVALAVWVAANA